MAIIDAISHGQLQTFAQLLEQFQSGGIVTIAHARAVVLARVQENHRTLAAQAVEVQHAKCPTCGSVMSRLPVNDRPATMVGGEYTAVLLCRNCHDEVWI